MTQAELADLVHMTESSISQLENGKQGFSNGTLESLSEALMCTPGELLDLNPYAAKDTPWLVFAGLSPESKAKVIDYIKMVRAMEESAIKAA
jgi:transcriptional regulator with XRE-family HTH domain